MNHKDFRLYTPTTVRFVPGRPAEGGYGPSSPALLFHTLQGARIRMRPDLVTVDDPEDDDLKFRRYDGEKARAVFTRWVRRMSRVLGEDFDGILAAMPPEWLEGIEA